MGAIPQTFYEVLEAIRKRPGMYMGRKSLAIFKAWLDGYNYARCELRAIRTAEEEEFQAFDEFVCEKYDWRDTGGWAAKIAYYRGDDADALDEFFRLLDEFRAARRLR